MTDRPAGVVLAAGAGTRLRPLTELLPKALCPVNNRPLVELALDRLAGRVAGVAVNVHHGRDLLVAQLAGRVHLSVEEPVALGTAGALGRLRDWIAGRPVLVTNVDAWLPSGLPAGFVEDWDGVRARLLVVADAMRADFAGGWRYAGAALLPWPLVATLPARPAGLYEASWRELDARGELDLVPAAGPFLDCGTPPDYLAANLAAAGGASVVGPGAVVEGELVRSVVWPDGYVGPGERLVQAVRAGRDVTVRVARLPAG